MRIPFHGGGQHAAKDVAFIRVVHPIAVDADQGVIAPTANLDRASKIALQIRIERDVEVVQPVREHRDEVARNAGAFPSMMKGMAGMPAITLNCCTALVAFGATPIASPSIKTVFVTVPLASRPR